jgi:hypothetical protein
MRATVCRSKQMLLTFTASLLNLLPPMRPAFFFIQGKSLLTQVKFL